MHKGTAAVFSSLVSGEGDLGGNLGEVQEQHMKKMA